MTALHILRQGILDDTRSDALVLKDDNTEDTVFEVDLITHLRLRNIPLHTTTLTAQLLVLIEFVPDDHAYA